MTPKEFRMKVIVEKIDTMDDGVCALCGGELIVDEEYDGKDIKVLCTQCGQVTYVGFKVAKVNNNE